MPLSLKPKKCCCAFHYHCLSLKSETETNASGLLNSSKMFLGGKFSPGSSLRAGLQVSLPSTSWMELQNCRNPTQESSPDKLRFMRFSPSCEFIQARALRLLSGSPLSQRSQLKTSLRARNVTFWIKIYITASQLFVDFDFLSFASTPFVFVRTRCASSTVFHSRT